MDSLASYIWPHTHTIHLCEEHRSPTSTILSWALAPFRLNHIPLQVCKNDERTLLTIETEQRRIVEACKTLAGLAQRTFCLPADIPVKIETEGTKSVISMELTNWTFCDCEVEKSDQLHPEQQEIFSCGSEEDTDEAERSMTLIREFIELSDAEESFLERKASIRRSLSPEDGSLDLLEEQHQTLIMPTRSLLDEIYSNDDLTKDEEDEDLEHLESHLNSSISRILSKIKKLKKSSNKNKNS